MFYNGLFSTTSPLIVSVTLKPNETPARTPHKIDFSFPAGELGLALALPKSEEVKPRHIPVSD
jgi:hypothetical protein